MLTARLVACAVLILTASAAPVLCADVVAIDPQPSEIEILFKPKADAKISYKTIRILNARDSTGRVMSWTGSDGRVMDIVSATADSVEVRLTMPKGPARATFTMSRRGAVEKVVFDRTMFGSDYLFGEALAQLVVHEVMYRQPWKSGDTRPLTVSLPPEMRDLGAALRDMSSGTVTFRRVVTLDGRVAAEFDYTRIWGLSDMRGASTRWEMTGQQWFDAKTGILLRLTGKVKGSLSGSSGAVSVDGTGEETVVLSESQGL